MGRTYNRRYNLRPLAEYAYRMGKKHLPAIAGAIASRYSHRGLGSHTTTMTKKSVKRSMVPRKRAYLAGKRRYFRKPSKRIYKRYKKAFSGVQFCLEKVTSVTDDKCVYAGHCSAPLLILAKYSIYTLYKRLLQRVGIDVVDWTTAKQNLTGDVFTFFYKTNMISATTSISYTDVAGNVTHQDVADALWLAFYNGFLNVAGGAAGMQSNALLQSLTWGSSTTVRAEINLMDAKVSFLTKSCLKMQNRSIPSAADVEADDIDNVPLYGKGYEGKGNGLVPRDWSYNFVPCDLNYGWSGFGAGSYTQLQEPPQVYHLQYAKKLESIALNPGKVKTSVLTDRISMSLDHFFHAVYAIMTSTVSDTNQYWTVGKVRMFAFERVIGKLAAELSPAINLVSEVDFKGWVDIYTKRGQYTNMINIVV